MRIGMFCDMYMPHVSGVTNYIRLYRRELAALGHEVFVFTWGGKAHEDDEPNIIRSPGIAFGTTGWQVPAGLSAEAAELASTLDVLHAHHPFVSGNVALRHAKLSNAPVVFTNHTRYDLYAETYASWIPSATRDPAVRRYLRWFTHEVDAVLAPSPEIAQWLAEWGVTDDAIVFRNAIDVEAFAHPRAPADRASLGFADDAVVVAYLGRVADEKNMSLLVDAFEQAAHKDSHLALLVIGDGPAREASERSLDDAGLADRAVFVGLTPYDRAPDLLAAADLFATASLSETWPLVVMEAAAAGLPTVGVESPGVGELVIDGENGVLVANDASAFSAALVRLARDEGARARLAAGARARAPEHDIRPAAVRMADLYRSLIAKHRGHARPARS